MHVALWLCAAVERADDGRHRRDPAVRIAAVLRPSLARRILHRNDLGPAGRSQAVRHLAVVLRHVSRGRWLGGHRHSHRPGGGNLSERVRLAADARHRQTAVGNPRRHSVGRVRIPCHRIRLAVGAESFPRRRFFQCGQREHRRGDHDPADDRVAQRGRAALACRARSARGRTPWAPRSST